MLNKVMGKMPKAAAKKKKKVTAKQALKNTAKEMGKASKKTAVKRGIAGKPGTRRKSMYSSGK